MAVYVDDARIPAQVGRIRARWSHLYADSQDELHAFAQGIGLRRAWFQPGRPIGGKPSRLWHYDVTESKRRAAIQAGAQPVGVREFRAIIDRRDAVTPALSPGPAAPGEAAPGEAAPGEAAPGEAAPGEAATRP